jgi:hypothetical protein
VIEKYDYYKRPVHCKDVFEKFHQGAWVWIKLRALTSGKIAEPVTQMSTGKSLIEKGRARTARFREGFNCEMIAVFLKCNPHTNLVHHKHAYPVA